MSDIVERLREALQRVIGHDPKVPGLSYDNVEQLLSSAAQAAREALAALAATPAVGGEREALLTKAAQDFIDKVNRGEARSKKSYAAFKAALAAPAASRGRESVREIAHRHCTCTCRGDPEVLQNHTNLCDEISDAILEYADRILLENDWP